MQPTLTNEQQIHPHLKASAQGIYRAVMLWLEGRYQSNTGPLGEGLLEIPVQIGKQTFEKPTFVEDGPVAMRVLRFRKVIAMGNAYSSSYAQSVERADLKIHYDPNWEAVEKLVELLNK